MPIAWPVDPAVVGVEALTGADEVIETAAPVAL